MGSISGVLGAWTLQETTALRVESLATFMLGEIVSADEGGESYRVDS